MAIRMAIMRTNLFKGVKIGFIGLLVVNIDDYNSILFIFHAILLHSRSEIRFV